MSQLKNLGAALSRLLDSGEMTWPEGWESEGKTLTKTYGIHTCTIRLGVWMVHDGRVSNYTGIQAEPHVPYLPFPEKGPRRPPLKGLPSPNFGDEWSPKKFSRVVALAAKAVDKYMSEFLPLAAASEAKRQEERERAARFPESPPVVKSVRIEAGGFCRVTARVRDEDLGKLFEFLRGLEVEK